MTKQGAARQVLFPSRTIMSRTIMRRPLGLAVLLGAVALLPFSAAAGPVVNVIDVAIDVPSGAAVEVYTLATPYRVVIELTGASSAPRPAVSAPANSLLVKSVHVEQGAGAHSRIVIDTMGPVAVITADWAPPGTQQTPGSSRLIVSLAPMEALAFGGGTGSAATVAHAASNEPARAPTASAPVDVKPALFDDAPTPAALLPTATKQKPVVMIDPGHGGIDPGAVGPGKITEKTIVLAVAAQLKAVLSATGRYDVRMTRSTDTFIPLDKRVALSKEAQAEIFISLHADTIEDTHLARSIRGASVYTLSDKASNDEARIMAEKENAADLVAGLSQHAPETGGDIKPILFDLMARETATFSKLLSRSVVGALSKSQPMTHEPERAAAFRVLRQPGAPSVLIELGFLSNPAEEQLMTGAAWQRQVATAIGAAVDTYFSRKGSSMATAPLGGDPGGLPP